MNKNLTRASIAAEIHEQVGLPMAEALRIVDDIFDEIIATLVRGEEVKIKNFAKFSIHHKAPRIGRNPKTKTESPIAERDVVIFTPSRSLKDEVMTA